VSELRSALEALGAEDLRALADGALAEDLLELHRARDLLEAELLRRLREFDRRGGWNRDGHLSASSWLADRAGISHSDAAGEVRMARALEAMPCTRESLLAGDVSGSAVKVLVSARETDPQSFEQAEPTLVEAATRHSVRDLGRVAAHWRNVAESRLVEQGDHQLYERRRLHTTRTVFGTVRIDAELDPEAGESVLTALGSYMDADARRADPHDQRTPAQCRADAMGGICRHWLDSSERPEIGGERPHLNVTLDLEALQGGAAHRCEFDYTGPVVAEVARLLACDSAVSRVVMAGPSEPLDLGRRTPVVPASLRRAVVIRDGHCRFPGCDRPPGWADCHHIVHWADGGSTSLSNLVLLCRRHHRAIHQRRFHLELVEGMPVFTRPDGSVLQDRAPP
jgi:hypothetical protein